MILLNRNTLGVQIRNSKIEYCGSIYRNNHNFAIIDWFNQIHAKLWCRLLLIPERYLDSIPKLGIPTHISKYFKYSVLTRYILHKYTPEIVQNNSICLVCDVVYFDFLVVESQRLVSDRRGGSHTTSHHQQHRA